MNGHGLWKEVELTAAGNRFSQYFINWWRAAHATRGHRYGKADRADINRVYGAIWETVRRHYIENEGGVCIRGLGYFCHVHDPEMHSPNAWGMRGVRLDFSYYRLMLITPSMLTDYHYMIDTFHDEVETAIAERVNTGWRYRFLWSRAKAYLEGEMPASRRFRVIGAGTKRGMPYLTYDEQTYRVQHSHSNFIAGCRKLGRILHYARLNPDMSREEIDGMIHDARRRASEKRLAKMAKKKRREEEIARACSKEQWVYDGVRNIRLRSMKEYNGKWVRDSEIWGI
jgi:hypothetical protein